MKLLDWINYTGAWTQPLTLYGLYRLQHYTQPDKILTTNDLITSAGLSLLPALICLTNNIPEYASGKRHFNFYDGFDGGGTAYTNIESYKAKYPKIPKQLISKSPSGIFFARDKKNYITKPTDTDGHIFLLGGSGSGKSSCNVIPTLISNPNVPTFAIDIKGELSFKSRRMDDDHLVIVDPNDRSQYGYDVFYKLKQDDSPQQIVNTMTSVAISLIPLPPSVKEPFWIKSAQSLFTGYLIYTYNHGTHEFIDILDQLLNKPIAENISEAVSDSDPHSPEYRYLITFNKMAEETLSGIYAELTSHINVMVNHQDVRYMFKDNALRAHPNQLNDGYSIFLRIKEEHLSAYSDIIRLIVNQTISEMELRPENSKPVFIIIDELARILSAGKLDRLLDASATLRSRKVTLFLISQSTDALMQAYTESEVNSLIANCGYIAVLNASTPKTQDAIIRWAGKYREQKVSWDGAGTKRKRNISYEDKDIITPSDLMTLQQKGEEILITPYGYCRFPKSSCYTDKALKPKLDAVMAHNRKILKEGKLK